ncbi:MAG: single-stranded-DNA-specific exonuclease RecJ [Thermodesulfobacteriota bacterium]|nr:MAG: single-stranded-DNA-specific exonuclease RecJ [Thermodesulfobacteriota bacterium]
MKKRWKVSPANKALQDELAKRLHILPLTAQLLINRGLVDCDTAFSFLRPELKSLHDPYLLKGMDQGVARIVEAMEKGEKMAVYGDYDVDGTSSTALLYLFFREIGVEVSRYIPDRMSEGYGMNAEAVKTLKASGVSLIITADCGTSNHEEIAFARDLGVDVIVTDHHEPSEENPPASAFINPKQKGCAFPFKGLAGVGVAFNLVMALRMRLRKAGYFKGDVPNLKRYLDLVAIGTVSDMVPLVDENRVFVRHGLKVLETTARPGLIALKDVAGIKPGKVAAYHIAFHLAPRLNAAGRLSRAEVAFKLLVSEDAREAAALAANLDSENSSRQKIEAATLKEALAMLGDGTDDLGIVLWSEKWHPGVIGIVASRLVERFSKPAVMIALEGEEGKGSARGVRSFSILEGIRACSAHLKKYGGHRAAAGLTVERGKVEGFRSELLKYINSTITEDDLVPEVNVDARVTLGDVDLRLISEIATLAPFGISNREPLLCIPDANIIKTEVVGGRHLRFRLAQKGRAAGAIGFGLARLHPVEGDGFAVAFSPYLDEWGGARKPGLRIKEIEQGVKFLT